MRLLDCFVGFQEVNLPRSFRGNMRGRAIKPEAHYIAFLTLANGCGLYYILYPDPVFFSPKVPPCMYDGDYGIHIIVIRGSSSLRTEALCSAQSIDRANFAVVFLDIKYLLL